MKHTLTETEILNLIKYQGVEQTLANEEIPEPILEKYAHTFSRRDWDFISYYQNLSKDFIKKFKDKINWKYIFVRRAIPEEFLREYINSFDKTALAALSFYQKLSEPFIEEFEDKVDWHFIFRKQNLSASFIVKFRNKLSNWDEKVIENENLTEQTIAKLWPYFSENIRKYYLKSLNNINRLIFLSKVKKEELNEF